MDISNTVTQLLLDCRQGNDSAINQLMPLVYEELRRIAAARMNLERGDHTLEPTALVHEAYIRLVNLDIPWQNRAHFFSVAAKAMRRILVDHARAKNTQKRQVGHKLQLDEAVGVSEPLYRDVIALDDALDALSKVDPRKSQITELHYFTGLKYDELSKMLDISEATVDRELRVAKAWLHQQISRQASL